MKALWGIRTLGFVIVALFAFPAQSIHADAESDRRRLIDEIDDQLEEAADDLRDLPSASDARPVEAALGYVSKVERLVDDLDDVKEDDSTARDIVDDYPDYIREFRTTAAELVKLKGRQPGAKELSRQCKALDTSMRERAASTKDGPGKAAELSEFAKSVGRQGEDLMSEAERSRSEIERLGDTVSRFSASHRQWSAVRAALGSDAAAIVESWKRDHDQAKDDCKDVVKRERHPDVERALGRLAGSTEGRAALRKKVDELLGQIAGKISDAQSHSDGSNINGAVELTREIESQLERLKAAQGDDDDASKIAAEWPRSVRELRTSLEALREMKNRQFKADEGAGRCVAAERELQDKLRGYLGDADRHKDGLKTLPGEAAAIGELWKAKATAAAEADHEMAAWRKIAETFGRSDGPWNDVRSKLHASAGKIFDHWHGKVDAATAACKDLVLGADNPDVKNALAEMQRDTSAASASYKELRLEFNRWYAQIEQLRDWSAQDVEEVRQAFCKAPDVGEYDEVYAIADRWSSNLNGLYGTIRGSGDRIKQSADALVAKKRAKVNGPKTKAAVDAALDSIAKIKSYELAGSNNPMLKAQATYGQMEHDRRQGSCQAKEVLVSGDYCRNPNPKPRDCKIDCVNGCQLIEIKPQSAVDLGDDQVEAYAEGLEKMFEAKGDAMFDGPLKIFAGCVSSDRKSLIVTTKVEPYDFCPKAEEIGPAIAIPPVSLAEEEE